MKPADFHPSQFAAGAKHTCTLDVETSAGTISLPVLLARGAAPGKTLAATAGIHGDEYEGPRAIYETFAELDPAEMSGSFLAVPVANPPAFWSVSRCNPIDGENLARAFSGRPGGNPTAAFAYALDQHLIAHAAFFIDLHSAGVRYLMPTMAGYHSQDERSRQAAMIFGAPVVWGHDVIAPGRTLSACLDRGIPFLYTEARGAGRIHPGDLRVFRRGLQNLLKHLAILPGSPEPAPQPVQLTGDGNTDEGDQAASDGFFVAHVDLLEAVQSGQEIGRILDLQGRHQGSVRASRSGVVGMLRMTPAVKAGDILVVMAQMQAVR
ncbi:MAG TPA: succinylglutamate desuccinylase/aspartoacylase family protein [Bryobacteraceae bacterium]|nr:succinylglutamate desuccinylase/aspartoacylase family protein [Bryobacteraceae bacterium]